LRVSKLPSFVGQTNSRVKENDFPVKVLIVREGFSFK
jgi:hypothetical protein